MIPFAALRAADRRDARPTDSRFRALTAQIERVNGKTKLLTFNQRGGRDAGSSKGSIVVADQRRGVRGEAFA
jgi:hypothetical protein